MTLSPQSAPLLNIEYPESDGEPMAESDYQRPYIAYGMGVTEYFQYDPSADYLEPPLQGYRLVEGNYFPLSATPLPNGGLAITSNVLGLALHLEEDELRFYNPETGEKLRSHTESEAAREAAEAKAARLAE